MRTIVKSTTGEYVGLQIRMPEPRDVLVLDGREFRVIVVSGNMIFTDLMTFYVE